MQTLNQISGETGGTAEQAAPIVSSAVQMPYREDETRPTPAIADWIPRANELAGYDVTVAAIHPFPGSRERLESMIARVRGPVLTADLLEPWVDVAKEDLIAFEVTVSEQWPEQ
ncbi:MAG: hypothetical protein ACLQOZ_01800 [Acidimicrobiales bacterium]|jgi:hypothetical protein